MNYAGYAKGIIVRVALWECKQTNYHKTLERVDTMGILHVTELDHPTGRSKFPYSFPCNFLEIVRYLPT